MGVFSTSINVIVIDVFIYKAIYTKQVRPIDKENVCPAWHVAARKLPTA
jgi:hypothetical protein